MAAKHLPLLIGRDFLTLARAVVDMGEKTLRVGTGVDNLVVSRAGHMTLRLNPRDWHREANLIEDIPVRLRARRKRQDRRTERLLQSIATFLINARCSPSTSAQKVSRSCLKIVAQSPHRDEHQRHCFVCSVPSDRCCGCMCSSSLPRLLSRTPLHEMSTQGESAQPACCL